PDGEGSTGRFMNKLMFGAGNAGVAGNDYSLFKCGGDDTLWAQAYSAESPSPAYNKSVFGATGNSYMGDYYGYKDHLWDSTGEVYRRFGAYNRPQNKFGDSAKSTLFWEPRFMQAIANTVEIGTANISLWGGNPLGAQPQNIPGHHGKMNRYNVTFADGHSSTVVCKKQ